MGGYLVESIEQRFWILRGLNLSQVFLAVIGRLFDLFSTRVALAMNPNVYEAVFLGNKVWLDVLVIIGCVASLQIFGAYYSDDRRVTLITRIGAWLVVAISFVPVFNNLEMLLV